jgi:hypothetical protein
MLKTERIDDILGQEVIVDFLFPTFGETALVTVVVVAKVMAMASRLM